MNIAPYLAHIQADSAARLTLDYLAHLQHCHLLRVPFENLSIIWGEPVTAEVDACVHKIVTRGRGGFCYELNGAFGGLLTALEFPVQLVSAQVYQGEPGKFGPAFDHLALLVTVNDVRYLVDVGFGDSCRVPLRFTPTAPVAAGERSETDAEAAQSATDPASAVVPQSTATDVSGRYRIRRAEGPNLSPDGGDHLWLLEAWRDPSPPAAWIPQYRFADTPYTLADFSAMCAYHSRNPASGFTRRIICSRATPRGRFTLSNDRLIITRGRTKTEFPVSAPGESSRILRAYFNVVK